MIEIYQPQFSPMYDLIWRFVAKCIDQETVKSNHTIFDAGKRRPAVISNPVAYKIVSPKLGLIQTAHDVQWHHICHPRLLAKGIMSGRVLHDDPWLELNWTMAYFNSTKKSGEFKCLGCRYRLTNTEILLVKATILSLRV